MITPFSCIIPADRDLPECTGNCVDVAIGGKLYVKTDGKVLSGVPINVTFIRNSLDFSKPSYMVASGMSNNNGTFNFRVTIDTSMFESYNLYVEAIIDSNYIAVDNGEKPFYSFDRKSFENINFEFYYKANLTIKFEKTSNDSIEHFHFERSYGIGTTWDFDYHASLIDAGIYFPQTIQTETAADMYTRINWKNKIVGKDYTDYVDSIICTKNESNLYIIIL
jgi:hypothetical protein